MSLWKNDEYATESSRFVACSTNNYIRIMVLTRHSPLSSWFLYCTLY